MSPNDNGTVWQRLRLSKGSALLVSPDQVNAARSVWLG